MRTFGYNHNNYRGTRWSALGLWLALSWLVPGHALAQEQAPDPTDIEAAKASFAEGVAASKQAQESLASGDKDAARESFAVATRKFLDTYRSAPNFKVLLNLGETYWALEQKVWSLACYQRFLAAAQAERDTLEAQITAAEKRVAELGEQPAPTPGANPLDPVDVCYDRPVIEDPEPSSPGDSIDDPLGLPVEPTEPTEPTGRPGAGYRAGFWISGGLTLVALTGGTVSFLQVAAYERDKLDAIRAYQSDSGNPPLDGYDACSDAKNRAAGDPALLPVIDACDAGESRALLSNALMFTAVAGAAVTGYLFYKGFIQERGANKKETAAVVYPVVSRESVGAGMMLRF